MRYNKNTKKIESTTRISFALIDIASVHHVNVTASLVGSMRLYLFSMYKRLFCFEKDNTIKASVLLLLLLFLNEEEEEEAMLVFLKRRQKRPPSFFGFFFCERREKKREMRSKLTLFEGVFFPSQRMGSLKKRFLTTKISTTLLDEVKKKREKGGK